MYETIHVLNFCANKFSWVPRKIILTQKLCQVEIIVDILLIKQLLATYSSLFFGTETAKCSQTCALCYPLQLEVSAYA